MENGNNIIGKPGPGRPKGSTNKLTTNVKQMIQEALTRKGGVKYFEKQAEANPVAFMTLIGKIMQSQVVSNSDSGLPSLSITFVESTTKRLDYDKVIKINNDNDDETSI